MGEIAHNRSFVSMVSRKQRLGMAPRHFGVALQTTFFNFERVSCTSDHVPQVTGSSCNVQQYNVTIVDMHMQHCCSHHGLIRWHSTLC